jgi:putative DNA primase/helicase
VALREMGLDVGSGFRPDGDDFATHHEGNNDAIVRTHQRAQLAVGTPVEDYLRGRGITLPIPSALRYLSQAPHRCGWYFPAMVALVVAFDGEPTGVHFTYIKRDGAGKYPFPDPSLQRECRGAMRGSSVHLAPYVSGQELGVAEGIETALSCMQLFDLPTWAALSTSGFHTLELPPEIRKVVIAVDNDLNGAGQAAALSLYTRLKDEGRSVRLLMPPEPGTDFNDALLAGAQWQ